MSEAKLTLHCPASGARGRRRAPRLERATGSGLMTPTPGGNTGGGFRMREGVSLRKNSKKTALEILGPACAAIIVPGNIGLDRPAAELRFGAEDAPLPRHAAQLAHARWGEAQPWARHQVLYRAGDQDFAGIGKGRPRARQCGPRCRRRCRQSSRTPRNADHSALPVRVTASN
jgi:hypothetical protein